MSHAALAAFSNNAVAAASIVYVLAFVAHLVEWVLGRSVPVAEPARGSTEEPARVSTGVPVAVGAGSEPVGREGSVTGVLEPEPRDGDTDDRDENAEGRAERVERFGRIGIALTVLAAALHLAGLITRGLGADPVRVPWGNMYEFSLTGTLAVAVIYLALLRRYQLRWLGPVVTGFNVVILMLAVLVLYEPAGPLVPALHSYWLVIHVIAAIVATGAFTVGGMASLLFLVRSRAEARAAESGTPLRRGYIARLPQAAVLDRVAYRLHAFGFPIWTFAALVAGPIWAQYAWGRYWGWDPKEVWAFITWVVYASYLHARATAGWKGKAAAIIALIGLATLLFNFVGINYFFGSTSQHSYAG
ncbi:MAG TPA: c-type cytochrome biogenesis protein CcsB [Nocardioidaceae bacterium]|nr:c-type cytochrome biogenesis protein CcsB [Nocardioidaceae bacterium]